MQSAGITYKKNIAQEAEIYRHLQACADNFTPALYERVDIANYAKKLAEKAINFEAWSNNQLVGLIAAYFNSIQKSVFITNVSVEKSLMGEGVAPKLLASCIQHATEASANVISLEVNINNTQAIRFYKKFSFETQSSSGDSLIMNLALINQPE